MTSQEASSVLACLALPMSPPQDQMTTNQLLLYANFLGFQAQLAKSGYIEVIILALRETQDDQPMQEEEAYIPSPSPVELAAARPTPRCGH